MVFNNDILLLSPYGIKKSTGIPSYGKHCPGVESWFSPVRQAPSQVKTPTNLIKGLPEPSPSASNVFEKKSPDVPVRDVLSMDATSWSNLDIYIHLSDTVTESDLAAENATITDAKKAVKSIPLLNAPSTPNKKKVKKSCLDESRPPKAQTRRLTQTIPKKVRRLSLGHSVETPQVERNAISYFSPKRYLKKQVSAFELTSPSSNKNCSTTQEHSMSSNDSNISEPTLIATPKQISAIELSPKGSRSSLPHWKKLVACDQIVCPKSPRMSPANTKDRKLGKNLSSRTISKGHSEETSVAHNTASYFSPRRYLKKQVSAFELISSLRSSNDSENYEPITIASPKTPLKRQTSAIELSTPEVSLSCFPLRKKFDFSDEIVSPNQSQCLKTSSHTKPQTHSAAMPPMSPTSKRTRGPSKQASERICSSPKWVATQAASGNDSKNTSSIPKVSSIHTLLLDFDKIMELP